MYTIHELEENGQAQSFLAKPGRPLWALLDAASAPQALVLMDAVGAGAECLFSIEAEAALSEFAPYLVPLKDRPELVRLLLDNCHGKGAVVWLDSDASATTLARHFRRFLMAAQPGGGWMFFRFYDPRVLRVWWPACTEAERAAFCGPARALWMEDENPARLLEARRAVASAGEPVPWSTSRFSLSRDHLRALELDARRRLVAELSASLRTEGAELAARLEPEAFRALVEDLVGRAERRGISRNDHVRDFVRLGLTWGEDFDERERWATAALSKTAANEEERMTWLLAEAAEQELPERAAR